MPFSQLQKPPLSPSFADSTCSSSIEPMTSATVTDRLVTVML